MSWYKELLARKYPYIVAEIEVSHEGGMDKARQIIDNLVDMGCDCVKFQSWTLDSLYAIGTAPPDLIEYAFTEKQYKSLRKYCGKRIAFSCSVFSEEEADIMERVGVPFFKIGSGDLTNLGLLNHVAKKKKPVVLSTGMGTLAEIEHALGVFSRAGNTEVVLLHCVSLYPPDSKQLNLRNIPMLQETFGVPVGFSDHTDGVFASLIAATLGAVVIEKHHPDPWFVTECEFATDALGVSQRIISEKELGQRKKFRRHWVKEKGEYVFKRIGT